MVEGFAPEVRVGHHGRQREAGGAAVRSGPPLRPCSATTMHNVIQSWRDLPKLYNQWCSVLRWEKTTRPFLRHREFLVAGGPHHACHGGGGHGRDAADAEHLCRLLLENVLAMPVVKGRKTDKEKFAGAEATYTVECHDARPQGPAGRHQPLFRRRVLPAPSTSPSPARTTSCSHPFQTSWGVSTRLIGGIIMTHGDDNGLVLPPGHCSDSGGGGACGPAQARRAGRCRGSAGPSDGAGAAGEDGRQRASPPAGSSPSMR